MKINAWVLGQGGGLSLGDGGVVANLKEHIAAGYLSHDEERDELRKQRKRPTLRKKEVELWKWGDRKPRETVTR